MPSCESHSTPIDEPYGSRLLPWQSASCTFLLLSSRYFFYISLSYNSLLLARTHGLREKNSPSLSLSAVFIPYFSLCVSLSLSLAAPYSRVFFVQIILHKSYEKETTLRGIYRMKNTFSLSSRAILDQWNSSRSSAQTQTTLCVCSSSIRTHGRENAFWHCAHVFSRRKNHGKSPLII